MLTLYTLSMPLLLFGFLCVHNWERASFQVAPGPPPPLGSLLPDSGTLLLEPRSLFRDLFLLTIKGKT